MFPGHTKIAGHSGTANKNRKAFSKREQLQKVEILNKKVERKRTAILDKELEDKRRLFKRSQNWAKFVGLYLKLPLYIVVIALVSFLVYKVGDVFTEKSVLKDEAYFLQKRMEHKNAYKLFVEHGNYHLERNRYGEAYLEFVKALELDDKGVEARVGLTQSLIKICELENYYCEEKDLNISYLMERNISWQKEDFGE